MINLTDLLDDYTKGKINSKKMKKMINDFPADLIWTDDFLHIASELNSNNRFYLERISKKTPEEFLKLANLYLNEGLKDKAYNSFFSAGNLEDALYKKALISFSDSDFKIAKFKLSTDLNQKLHLKFASKYPNKASDYYSDALSLKPVENIFLLYAKHLEKYLLDFSKSSEIYEKGLSYFPHSKNLLEGEISVLYKMGNLSDIKRNFNVLKSISSKNYMAGLRQKYSCFCSKK